MNLAKVISFIEEALVKEGLSFAKLDSIILEAAWEDVTYVLVGQRHSVNVNTLKGQAAPQLWRKLRQVFGVEIGKKSFRRIITDIIADEAFNRPVKTTATLPSHTLTVFGATPPSTNGFVGRGEELTRLSRLLDAYPLLSVVGPDGIGKKTLIAKLIESGYEMPFKSILWKPLHHVPTPDELGAELLATMGTDTNVELLAQLQSHPALIVLDATTQKPGRQAPLSEYISLIRRVTEETPSKVITISTRPLAELEDLVLRGQAISYHLRGLTTADAKALLHKRWHSAADELCKAVGGNPLLLKKIDGWYDYVGKGSLEGIDRLTILSGLVGDFYDSILTGTVLSTAELGILRDIAEAQHGISFADLLSQRPEKAPIIRRLIDMGLAHKTSNNLSIRLDPLFGRQILGAR